MWVVAQFEIVFNGFWVAHEVRVDLPQALKRVPM